MKRIMKKCATDCQQTKVGIIPNDWRVVYLKEVATIKRGKFSPRPRNDPRYFGGKIPFVQTNIIVKSNGIIKNYSQTLNSDGLKVSRLFPKGTILMTIAANIGFTGILQEAMACTDSIVGIECSSKVYNVFLNYYLTSIQVRIDHIAEKAAQKNINLKTLNILKIPLPPIEEQNKIAKILGTWDKAISIQQQLIQQKQQLKKGLMQKLLSVDIRFKEFNEDWKTEKLETLTNFYLGLTYTPSYVREGIPFLSVKDIKNSKLSFSKAKYISENEFHDCTNNSKPRKGDIVFGRVGTLGNPVIIETNKPFCIFVSLGVLRVKPLVETKFIKYWMESDIFKREVESKVAGSSQKNLNIGWLRKFKINIPLFIEQKKIAQVLSLADKEIELLQEHLQQLLQQKQGLMQKLLTGEVRVKTQGNNPKAGQPL